VSDWRWLRQDVVLAAPDAQLAEHGGASGLRDAGLLDSALARPQNLAAYAEPDAADLAAAHAFGIVRNHPFVDGNKRTALVAAELFLVLNGRAPHASDETCVIAMRDLAAGTLSEAAFASWLTEHMR